MRVIVTTGIALLSIVILSCTKRNSETPIEMPNGFRIDGQVSGIADSTWLILQSNSNEVIDSARVLHGQFSMTGKVIDSIETAQVILRTKDFSDYKFFWLENSNIKFNGVKGNFRLATIAGSKTQAEADAYNNTILPIDRKLDSLNNISREPNIAQSTIANLGKQRSELEEEKKKLTFAFIRNNSNSIVSVSLLDIYSTMWERKVQLSCIIC